MVEAQSEGGEKNDNFSFLYQNISHVAVPGSTMVVHGADFIINSQDDLVAGVMDKFRPVEAVMAERAVKEKIERERVQAQIVEEDEARAARLIDAEKVVAAKAKPKKESYDWPKKKEPEFKAGKFRVVKADGIGWYDVVGIDGKAITGNSMRKDKAEKMAAEKNLE